MEKPKKLKASTITEASKHRSFLPTINSFISPANRFNGELFDIMRVSRIDDTYRNWTDPVVMSDTINSVAWDSYYKTNIKGSWAYFCSDKNGNTKSDIYRVKIYEENPFVIVTGIVMNTSKNAPLNSKYSFKILADGKVVDSVTINPDSAKFRIKLPLGRKYYVAADVTNFISTQEIIDMADIREYTEMTQNLKSNAASLCIGARKTVEQKNEWKNTFVCTTESGHGRHHYRLCHH